MGSAREIRRSVKTGLLLAGTALAIGTWLWMTAGDGGLPLFVAAALVAGLAIAAILAWDGNRRAWDRWHDAVDSFAAREIAQTVRDSARLRTNRLTRRIP